MIFPVINAGGRWRPCCWPIPEIHLKSPACWGHRLTRQAAIFVPFAVFFFFFLQARCWNVRVSQSVQWNMGKHLLEHHTFGVFSEVIKNILGYVNIFLGVNCRTVSQVLLCLVHHFPRVANEELFLSPWIWCSDLHSSVFVNSLFSHHTLTAAYRLLLVSNNTFTASNYCVQLSVSILAAFKIDDSHSLSATLLKLCRQAQKGN